MMIIQNIYINLIKKYRLTNIIKDHIFGIILEINNLTYFAPMFSPKQQHSKYKANATHIRIGENLGLIRLNNMIPVNKNNLKYIDFNKITSIIYDNSPKRY